ncbi:SGNH/GDSL hydrolase family protein [Amorphoplanes digitatis]|uniref:Lysophospholipase L1-like esterase n=1 Tax=Actinoplanes digitatis TaxID=1868 RepID=A0A7W7MQX0_9ACTN|nr:SGNH/GDSL hydrolase family protein [Actinoplanes digitatis]MBB4763686.1 lysophospholipase L1-like esterase [Actinoplanes digitatis]GID93055.1 SGNH hydrolase [Actinoplanes digitatis]
MNRRTILGLGAAAAVSAATVHQRGGPRPKGWLHTWVSMPQLTEPGNMPPAPFNADGVALADTTLRQTVQTSIAGSSLRVRFSNAFGGAVLPITGVTVALPLDGRAGASAIVAGSARAVTFSGRPGASVPVGAQVVSDPIDLDVPALTNLTVTAYLATGQASAAITSHPGSRTTSHLLRGDHRDAAELPGATPVDHWYFLSGVEVRTAGSATVVLGDSLTDGRGSTTNGNDRWPDRLKSRLRDVAVLNQAAGGNRVLQDGLGPNALGRLDRDVLALGGADRLIVFEGVNDIGTAAATPAAQLQVGEDLVAAYDQMVTRSHARGIRVYGATITPFGGNTGYDDADGLREGTRRTVNDWIRRSGRFDAVLDFDAAVRDPIGRRRLLPAYDTGDHLHLNPTGYQAIADSVPDRLFRR